MLYYTYDNVISNEIPKIKELILNILIVIFKCV